MLIKSRSNVYVYSPVVRRVVMTGSSCQSMYAFMEMNTAKNVKNAHKTSHKKRSK